jgi:hypothetical protein
MCGASPALHHVDVLNRANFPHFACSFVGRCDAQCALDQIANRAGGVKALAAMSCCRSAPGGAPQPSSPRLACNNQKLLELKPIIQTFTRRLSARRKPQVRLRSARMLAAGSVGVRISRATGRPRLSNSTRTHLASAKRCRALVLFPVRQELQTGWNLN